MELLVITSVKAYENDIKKMLKQCKVRAYSQMDVTGYVDSDMDQGDNWFASSAGEYRSTLFYAFVEPEKVKNTLDTFQSFNDKQESSSHIHCMVMQVKQSI